MAKYDHIKRMLEIAYFNAYKQLKHFSSISLFGKWYLLILRNDFKVKNMNLSPQFLGSLSSNKLT